MLIWDLKCEGSLEALRRMTAESLNKMSFAPRTLQLSRLHRHRVGRTGTSCRFWAFMRKLEAH